MPTPLRAGLVLLLVSSPALAQQISLAFGSGNASNFPFNQGSCNNNSSYIITWTASGLGSGTACANMQIFVTNAGSCPNSPNTGGGADAGSGVADVIIQTVDINTLATGSGTVPAQRLRDMPGLGGSCPDGITVTNAVCASVQTRAVGSTSCDTFQTSTTNLTLQYDAKPPVPPGMNLLPQDAKIQVQLNAEGETLSRFEVQYAEAPPGDAGPDWRQGPSLEATKTSVAITGLTNGVEYLVQARSVDVVDNVSAFNTPLSATPQSSNGFWGEYKDAGGHDTGGCSSAGAAFPSVLGALGVLVALLRRRR
jgi:uncharacterized protein (TIGR03382 family)